MSELKPCPFCGADAIENFEEETELHLLGCETAGCPGQAVQYFPVLPAAHRAAWIPTSLRDQTP